MQGNESHNVPHWSDDEQFWLHAQLAQPGQQPPELNHRTDPLQDAHVREANLLRAVERDGVSNAFRHVPFPRPDPPLTLMNSNLVYSANASMPLTTLNSVPTMSTAA